MARSADEIRVPQLNVGFDISRLDIPPVVFLEFPNRLFVSRLPGRRCGAGESGCGDYRQEKE